MDKYKSWVKNNQDKIVVVGLGAVLGTALIALVVVAIKADVANQERLNAKLNAYIDELNAAHRAQEVQESRQGDVK